jgi:hypothetical protein
MSEGKTQRPEATRLWNAVSVLGLVNRRSRDERDLHAERIRALEDRLAQLDGRDDSSSACRNAQLAVAIARTSEGGEALTCRYGADGKSAPTPEYARELARATEDMKR